MLPDIAGSVADSLLPGGGPLAKWFIDNIVAERNRRTSLALKTAEHYSGMSREDLAERIAEDATLHPLWLRILHAAGMLGHDDTLQAMGCALSDAITHPEKVDECQLILTALTDLGPTHTSLLKLLSTEGPLRGEANVWTPEALADASELPASIVPLVQAALVGRGLALIQAGGYGGPTVKLTELGETVLVVFKAISEQAGRSSQ